MSKPAEVFLTPCMPLSPRHWTQPPKPLACSTWAWTSGHTITPRIKELLHQITMKQKEFFFKESMLYQVSSQTSLLQPAFLFIFANFDIRRNPTNRFLTGCLSTNQRRGHHIYLRWSNYLLTDLPVSTCPNYLWWLAGCLLLTVIFRHKARRKRVKG